MRASLVVASWFGALMLSACSTEFLSPSQFRIFGLVTTKLSADSSTCSISWRSEVNDPNRPYIVQVGFSGDTGVLPDTGTFIHTDSLFSTGSASVAGDFHKPEFLVGWHFYWDTLSTTDSAHVHNCLVS